MEEWDDGELGNRPDHLIMFILIFPIPDGTCINKLVEIWRLNSGGRIVKAVNTTPWQNLGLQNEGASTKPGVWCGGEKIHIGWTFFLW